MTNVFIVATGGFFGWKIKKREKKESVYIRKQYLRCGVFFFC
jgi:hypothetical protein